MRSNHKNGVCRLIDKATEGIVRYFQDIDFLKSINIFRVDEHSVWLDFFGNRQLYCAKLESGSNNQIEYDEFYNFVKEIRYSSEGEVFLCISSDVARKNIYVFSFLTLNLKSYQFLTELFFI